MMVKFHEHPRYFVVYNEFLFFYLVYKKQQQNIIPQKFNYTLNI